MFDIGFIEFLVVAIAALLFVRPHDWPRVIRYVSGIWRDLQSAVAQVKQEVAEVGKQTNSIIGLDGKEHIAYDVSELDELQDQKTDTRPPASDMAKS